MEYIKYIFTHRLVANASISSKNTIQGATARARRKSDCTAFSLSPSHLDNNSGPRTEQINQ